MVIYDERIQTLFDRLDALQRAVNLTNRLATAALCMMVAISAVVMYAVLTGQA